MALSMDQIYQEILRDGGETPSKKVRETAQRFPDMIAMRYKEFGLWQETTYEDFWLKSNYLGMALRHFGVEKGNSVAIHSENRPEWFIADIGIQSMGYVSVGLYPSNPSSEVQYLLSHSESKILFAEDQEQVDKALEVIDDLPGLEKIIYFEERGLYNYDHPKLMKFAEFLEIGKTEYDSHPTCVDEHLDAIEDEDIAFLVYTSGTTGPPKGSMISHGNIKWVGSQIPNFSLVESVTATNPQFLSYLPLCHIFGRLTDLLIATHTHATINFAESIDTVQMDLVEIQPTIFPAVPRILERMHAGAIVRMKDATFLKKQLFQISMYFGNLGAERKIEKGFNDKVAQIYIGIGWLLAFRTLKKKLGLSKAETAISGAAPIAPEILKFFLALGVPIFEGYGMTENCAYASGNNDKKMKLGTVGVPNHGVEIKLADDGEILVKSPAVFKGYFKDEAATKECIDRKSVV